MKAPPPFPRTSNQTDLDAWSVYGDWLQTQSDPRGELIAFDLSLPSAPSEDSIRAYRELGKRSCRLAGGSVTNIAWSLGHARVIAVREEKRMSKGPPRGPDASTLANLTELLRKPHAALLEELWFPYSAQGAAEHHWKRLMAALPVSCTRLKVNLLSPITIAEIEELRSIIPSHVREMAVGLSGASQLAANVFIPGLEAAAIACFIDDRFDLIEITEMSPFGDYTDLEVVLEKLLETKTVRIRVGTLSHYEKQKREAVMMSRMEIGAPGDAALVYISHPPNTPMLRSRDVVVLPRWSLVHLQRRFGLIPIRAQLERQLSEGYCIYPRMPGDAMLRFTIWDDHDLMRRGEAWTIRVAAHDADPARAHTRVFRRDGIELPPGITPVNIGDHLTFGPSDRPWRLANVNALPTLDRTTSSAKDEFW